MNASASPLRRALARLAAILLVAAPTLLAQCPPSYSLSFDDEFNATSVNTSVWQYRTDGKDDSQQLAANVSESGGYLHIAVKQQTSGSYSYTGGGVITIGGFGYGYYEASVKVPPGYGWHSSFWAQAYNGTDTGTQVADQELDFMEQESGGSTDKEYTANYHFWPTSYYAGATISGPNSMSGTFNTIGCLYTPYGTTYYLNGVQVEVINTSAYASNNANIWLTAIATHIPDTSYLPSEFLVDWVHYYAPSASGSAPAAPVGFQATTTASQISLSWTAPLGAASYAVKRGTASGGPYTTIASGLTSPSYTDSTVSGTNPYYYVVDAVSSNSVASANSAEVSIVPATVIVDDAASSGITLVGAWTSSTYNSGYYASDYLSDGDTGGGKSVTFTPNLYVTGVYHVLAHWAAAANRATNALYDIVDSTGTTTTISENQQVNGGQWVDLGTYAFNSGTSGYVRLRDDGANGYVIADAVEFVPATGVILDNTAASGVTIAGSWTASTSNSGYYGTNYLQDGDAGGGKSVTYAPNLPSAGTYKVYVRWAAAANRATNVPIDVTDGSGTTTTSTVNQQTDGGTWNAIGTFTFNAGTSGTVKIRDDGANGYVIADAVSFVLQ